MAVGKNIKGITIEFSGDTTKLGKALSDVDKKTKDLDRSIRQVDRALKFNPGNTELLAQKQQLLSQKIGETKTRLEALKDAQAKLDDDPAVDKTSQDYMELRREIIETESKLTHFESQLKELNNVKFEELGKKIEGVGGKMQTVGDGMTKYVTAPIAGAAAASVTAWKEVDNGLDIVAAKTGASGKALEGMHNIVKNIAQSVPADFETIGTAVGEVNTRFGLTGDALESLSTKFVQFADLNNVDVNTAIDTTQKAMAAFGMSADEAEGFLDVLNKVGQDTGVDMNQLAQSLVTNAGALKSMGLNSTEAANFVGQLEKSGVDASAAMGGLQKAMVNGAKEGKSMGDVLKDVQDRIVNAGSDTDALAAATEIFGAKAAPKMADALRSGALDLEALSNSSLDAKDSVSKTFEETMDPADKFQLMLNSLKVTGYEVANTMFTSLAPAIEKLAGWLKDMAGKWAELSPSMQMFILKAAGIVAIIGPILSIVGRLTIGLGGLVSMVPKIVSGFSAIGKAFTVLKTVMLGNPWMLVAAAAIAAIVLIVKNWDKIKEFFTGLWEQVKVIFTGAWEAIKTGVSTAWESIKALFVAVWEGINQVFTTALGAIKSAADAVWNGIKTVIETVFNGIKLYFQTIFNIYKTIFTVAWNAYKKLVIDPIKSAASTIKEVFTKLKTGLSERFDAIKKTVTDKFKAIKDGITKPIKEARDKIKEIIEKIKGFFNFKAQLPKIKLPHFKIDPPGWKLSDLLEGIIPSLGIEWYAKGGIFRSPSLIGVGEKGPEAVIPIEKLEGMFERMAATILEGMGGNNLEGVVIQTNVELDGKLVGKSVTPVVNNGLYSQSRLDRRFT